VQFTGSNSAFKAGIIKTSLADSGQPENTLKYITSVEQVAAIDRSSSVRSGIGLGFGLALVLV
jgi:hypothetical protein